MDHTQIYVQDDNFSFLHPNENIPCKTLGPLSKIKFNRKGNVSTMEHLTQFLRKCITHNVNS